MEKNNKTTSIIALVILILILVFIALFITIKATPEEPINNVENPMVEVNGIEGITQILSFFYQPTAIPQNYALSKTFVISNAIGDVRYIDNNGNKIQYRMALLAQGNISGDINEYKQMDSAIISDSITAKLEGNNGLIYKATWKDENYTYALSFNNGYNKTSVIEIIKSTIKANLAM